MKKTIAIIAVIALALTLTVALAACNKEVGKYYIVGENEAVMDNAWIELKSGGKVTIHMEGEDDENGTYKLDGEKLTITIDGDAQELTLKDGKITSDGHVVAKKK